MILESMTKAERSSAFGADCEELYYQCRKLQNRKTDTVNRRIVNYRSKNNNDYILVPILMYAFDTVPNYIVQYEPICTFVDKRGVKRYYKFTQLWCDGFYEIVELTTHLLKRVRERMPELPKDFDKLAAWCFEKICISHLCSQNILLANPDLKGSSLICGSRGLFVISNVMEGNDDKAGSIENVMTFLSVNELKKSYKYREIYQVIVESYPDGEESGYMEFFCNDNKEMRTVIYDISKQLFYRV